MAENQVPGALESVRDHKETVKHSLNLRGIKIKHKEIPIPVAFAAAFEGEIIRKNDMHAEFSSQKNPAFELVAMRDENEIEDHKLTLVGPDIDGEAPVGPSSRHRSRNLRCEDAAGFRTGY